MSDRKIRKRDTGEQGNKGQFGTRTRGEAEVAVPQSRFVGTDGADQSATQWWERAAQLTDASGMVPTMGRDDGRPHRRTYTGDDYSVTMPSRTPRCGGSPARSPSTPETSRDPSRCRSSTPDRRVTL